MQGNHSDCSKVAQHATHVKSDSLVPIQPALSTIQSDSSQESVKIRSACLAPRASAIKEQAFCEAVAAGIEAPQRGSTRSVIADNWVIDPINVSTVRIFLVSWTVHRDRPQGWRDIPSWNLPLVLHLLARLHSNLLKRPL